MKSRKKPDINYSEGVIHDQSYKIHNALNEDPERSKREDQKCRFCLDPESILTLETCCTGCGALNL